MAVRAASPPPDADDPNLLPQPPLLAHSLRYLAASLPFATLTCAKPSSRRAYCNALAAVLPPAAARRAAAHLVRQARATALRALLAHLSDVVQQPRRAAAPVLRADVLHPLLPLLLPNLGASPTSSSSSTLHPAAAANNCPDDNDDGDADLRDSHPHVTHTANILLPLFALAALHAVFAAPTDPAPYRAAMETLRSPSFASIPAHRVQAATRIVKHLASALYNNRRDAARNHLATYAATCPSLNRAIADLRALLTHDQHRLPPLHTPETPHLSADDPESPRTRRTRRSHGLNLHPAPTTQDDIPPPYFSDGADDHLDPAARAADLPALNRRRKTGSHVAPLRRTPPKRARSTTTHDTPVTPAPPPPPQNTVAAVMVVEHDDVELVDENDDVLEVAVLPSRRTRMSPRAHGRQLMQAKGRKKSVRPALSQPESQAPSATVRSAAIARELAEADSSAFSDDEPTQRPVTMRYDAESSEESTLSQQCVALHEAGGQNGGNHEEHNNTARGAKRRRVGGGRYELRESRRGGELYRESSGEEEEQEEKEQADTEVDIGARCDGARRGIARSGPDLVSPRSPNTVEGNPPRGRNRTTDVVMQDADLDTQGDESPQQSKRQAQRQAGDQQTEDEVQPAPAGRSVARSHSRRGSQVLRDLRAHSASLLRSAGEDPLPESRTAAAAAKRKERTRRLYEPQEGARDASPLPRSSSSEEERSPLPRAQRVKVALQDLPITGFGMSSRHAFVEPEGRINGLPIKRGRFSSEEDKWLVLGLKEFGWGQWSNISREFGHGESAFTRTGISLKDRARSLLLDPAAYPVRCRNPERRGRKTMVEVLVEAEDPEDRIEDDPDEEGQENEEGGGETAEANGDGNEEDQADDDENDQALAADSQEVRDEEAAARVEENAAGPSSAAREEQDDSAEAGKPPAQQGEGGSQEADMTAGPEEQAVTAEEDGDGKQVDNVEDDTGNVAEVVGVRAAEVAKSETAEPYRAADAGRAADTGVAADACGAADAGEAVEAGGGDETDEATSTGGTAQKAQNKRGLRIPKVRRGGKRRMGMKDAEEAREQSPPAHNVPVVVWKTLTTVSKRITRSATVGKAGPVEAEHLPTQEDDEVGEAQTSGDVLVG